MRPTKKEKYEWIFVRRQRTVGTCRSTSTNTGMVKLALPRIAAADLGRAPPITPTVPDAAPPTPLPANSTHNAIDIARASHCLLLKTAQQHRFTQNSSCVLTRYTRSHHAASTSLAIGIPLSASRTHLLPMPQHPRTRRLCGWMRWHPHGAPPSVASSAPRTGGAATVAHRVRWGKEDTGAGHETIQQENVDP